MAAPPARAIHHGQRKRATRVLRMALLT